MFQLPLSFTIILAVATVAVSLLYLREYFQRKKNESALQKTSLETKQQSIQLLDAARLAQTQVLAQEDYATKKLIEDFNTKLATLLEMSQQSISASQSKLIDFMSNLQKRGTEFEQASKSATEQRISQMFERLETRLSDFLVQTEQKTTSSIELEIKATRQLIETYKAQQLKLIDENIIAMMEQTMSIALGKKLSLKEQLDLIYEALEKAKMDKFIM